ncbi:MAG: argininosuccinate synthase [Planctomycetes bacterium]|nr:argininosuccinate synthase [Planctomycetota bacterium]
MSNKERIVLLYSGGLDTSVILKWLCDKGYEVLAYTCNVGQREEWSQLEGKAKASGASGFLCDDLCAEFVSDFVMPAVAFGARYEDRYMLGTSLARPLILKGMIDYCMREGVKTFCHGATGKGNDQVRFELTAAALAPELKAVVPWRTREFREQFPGRQEMIAYAMKNNIPIKATTKKPWSSDENLMHISFEAGVLEDPWYTPDEEMFELTVSPEKAPDRPRIVELEFQAGLPVALDGKALPLLELFMELNRIAGENGIGRIDIVESRYVGMKSRGVYETPGGAVLHAAYRDLETITCDRGIIQLKDSLMPRFAKLVYDGYWYGEECRLLRYMLADTMKRVSGTVRLKLYKGNLMPVGRKSPLSLYDSDVASMENDHGAYDQDDATGFIRLNALPLRTIARRKI